MPTKYSWGVDAFDHDEARRLIKDSLWGTMQGMLEAACDRILELEGQALALEIEMAAKPKLLTPGEREAAMKVLDSFLSTKNLEDEEVDPYQLQRARDKLRG